MEYKELYELYKKLNRYKEYQFLCIQMKIDLNHINYLMKDGYKHFITYRSEKALSASVSSTYEFLYEIITVYGVNVISNIIKYYENYYSDVFIKDDGVYEKSDWTSDYRKRWTIESFLNLEDKYEKK